MVRNSRAGHYPDQELWWGPVHLDSSQQDDAPIFSPAQVKQWLEDGFLIVTGLWPEELIDQAAAMAAELHPKEQVAEDGRGFSEAPWLTPRGEAPENPLNHMCVSASTPLHAVRARAAQLLFAPQQANAACRALTPGPSTRVPSRRLLS
jgi:hypothetical protein